jgi:hypothetical protein
MKPYPSILIAILALVMALGCSSGKANPTLPSDNSEESLGVSQTNVPLLPNRHLWGLWEINISEDRQVAEIIPARSGEMHLNVVRLLEVFPCKNCLTIGNIKMVEPNVLEADLTLVHPYPGLLKYTGFDVRGIFIAQTDFTFPASGRKVALGDGVPRVLNPDGYTSLFNPTEYPPTSPPILGYIPGKHATGGDLTATLNPYLAYRRDAPRRMFESGGSETRTFRLYAPSGPIHFGYAVDASWQLVENVIDPLTDFPPDANCLEAYKIKVDIPKKLDSTPGSQAVMNVEVFDHQGLSTIQSVTIEAPDLFSGAISLAYSTQTGEESWLFSGTITNETGTGHGFYPLLATVVDTESDQNLGEIEAWQVAQEGVVGGWARTWGGTDFDWGHGVALDGSGNVYVTGSFMGTSVDFDPDPLAVDFHSSNGGSDIFLSKFDSSGTFLWARTWGGSESGDSSLDYGYGVAVDESGYVYVTGWFSGTSVDFNPDPVSDDPHSSNGALDIFLSRFDSSGTFLWARTWGGISDDYGEGVAVDGSGNVYVTGSFQDTSVDFDPDPTSVDPHSSHGYSDIFLSRFDSSGTFAWARTWGWSSSDVGYGVAVDGSGNLYVTGSFSGTFVDFNPDPLADDFHSSNGGDDIFLSEFDSSGTYVWARTWGGSSDDYGEGVAVDGSGNVCVTGYFGDIVDFNPDPTSDDPHSSNGGYDIFLSKFDFSGTFVWARTWGGSSDDSGSGVAADGSGNAYVIGAFQGASVDFNPDPASDDPHSSNGADEIFLSKFDSPGTFLWARTWGGNDVDWGWGVDVDGSGNVYVTGGFSDTSVDFDPDPSSVDPHSSNGDADIFLSKFKPDGYW